jgi:hypothetical protein
MSLQREENAYQTSRAVRWPQYNTVRLPKSLMMFYLTQALIMTHDKCICKHCYKLHDITIAEYEVKVSSFGII